MARIKCDRVSVLRRRQGAFLVALAALFLAAPAGLAAARQGATLRLLLLDGTSLHGELLAVKGEVLLLQNRSGGGVQAGIRDIAEVHIVREDRVGKGVVGGLVAGFVVGGLIGIPFALSGHNELSILPSLILGGMGGGVGAIVGLGAGLISSSDEKIHCRGRDESWRSVALKRLLRLARFSDYAGPPAGGGTITEAQATALPLTPLAEEFRRWHLGTTIIHSPPVYTRAARAFSGGLRYGDPITAGAVTSAQMSDEYRRRNWLGLEGISCDYSLDRRWTIGIRFNPFSRIDSVRGAKTLDVSAMEATTSWYMEIANHACFLTASYSFITADGFMRDKALRLNAGLGWSRTRLSYHEYGYRRNSDSYDDPANFSYSGGMEAQSSSAFSAMVEAEAAHYFNTRWTIALDAGFRYVPMRIRGQESIGFIERRAPLPDQSPVLTIPGTTLNIGGLYCGVKLGFNF